MDFQNLQSWGGSAMSTVGSLDSSGVQLRHSLALNYYDFWRGAYTSLRPASLSYPLGTMPWMLALISLVANTIPAGRILKHMCPKQVESHSLELRTILCKIGFRV